MRRILAVSLLSMISLMLIWPLLAPDAEANLPPCCRRHGKHHCSMMEPLTGSGRGVRSLQEKCPFQRVAKTSAHTSAYQPEPEARFFATIVSLPERAAQTEALGRIALDRSRLKRGPPAFFL
jgi:hypothetical protein